MHSKLILVPVLLALLGAACGKTASEDDLREDRIIKMIDERRFEDVVDLLEPLTWDTAHLPLRAHLAEAYLGLAGFEPMEFAGRVVSKQSLPAAERTDLAGLEALIPSCTGQAVSNLSGIPPRCLIKRLVQQLPDPDQVYFARARDLLRTIYPDPAKTPRNQNFLAGLVEVASAFGRMGRILMVYQKLDAANASDEELDRLFLQISKTATEAKWALARARQAGPTISKLITGLDNQPVFTKSGLTVQFTENTLLPQIILVADHSDIMTTMMKITIIKKLDLAVNALQGN